MLEPIDSSWAMNQENDSACRILVMHNHGRNGLINTGQQRRFGVYPGFWNSVAHDGWSPDTLERGLHSNS